MVRRFLVLVLTPREREEAKFDLNLSYPFVRKREGRGLRHLRGVYGGRERERESKSRSQTKRNKGGLGIFSIFVVYHGRERETQIGTEY